MVIGEASQFKKTIKTINKMDGIDSNKKSQCQREQGGVMFGMRN